MFHSLLFNPQLTPAGAGLAGALVGAGSTLAITVVNGFFNRNRFQREHLWERRQAACNEIVNALLIAQRHGQHISAGFSDNVHDYFKSRDFTEANEQYLSFIKIASKAFHFNYLILPTSFRQRFERMVRDQVQYAHSAGPEQYLGPIAVDAVAARDLMEIALAELEIAGFWQRKLIGFRSILRTIQAPF